MQKALSSKEHISFIFVYRMKAFDTVNHVILLDKLEINEVRGIPLELIWS